MLKDSRIAFIGSGAMGEAIIRGLLEDGAVTPSNIVASDPMEARRVEMSQKYGVSETSDNKEAVDQADIVIFCVKPQVAPRVMGELQGAILPESLVLSIMAGVPIAAIESALDHQRIVRCMPNTPAQIGMGVTVWTATEAVTDEQKAEVEVILGALGEQIAVYEERYLDMATGLSGSGPAFVFLFTEAMIDAGVHIGFSRVDAEKLVLQTMQGSLGIIRESGMHPAELRNRVTSPAGTTAAGLYEMEAGAIRGIMLRAVEAAYRRSVELGGS